MANEENLKKGKATRFKSGEEAARNGKKGGEASAKARAERKTLKEELLLLLSEGDTQKKVSAALIKKAKSGNVKAFEVIRDTIGEKPMEKILASSVDPETIAEVEKFVMSMREEKNDEKTGD